MITARQTKELAPQEQAAFVKFFKDNPALGQSESPESTHNANQMVNYLADAWKVIIDGESLRAGFKALSEAGRLKLRNPAQQKFDQASRGYNQQNQDLLETWLRHNHLVFDPADDRAFINYSAFYEAMRGREFNGSNLNWCRDYLIGKGVKLHWLERKDPDAPEYRGHRFDRNDPNVYRFAPKSETNRPSLPSHSGNKYLNGEAEREKREAERKRFNKPDEDVMAAHNYVWRQMLDKAVAEGRTHLERNRIAQAAQQCPGGIRLQAEAAEKEAALIRRERERAR